MTIPTINTADLKAKLENDDWLILDTRSSSAFIGWQLDNEKHPGHIKGATDFSVDWLTFSTGIDAQEKANWLNEKMRQRRITAVSKIVLYDSNGKDHQPVYDYLTQHQIQNIYYYCLADWDGEFEDYPGYKSLVPVERVKQIIDEQKVETAHDHGYQIFEVSWGEPSASFLQGHIPHSVHIDSEEFEKGPEWVRVSDEELTKFAGRYGITQDSSVILYGMNTLNAAGAAKLALVLRYMRVKNVHLLNGTMNNWHEKGYPVEKGDVNKPVPAVFIANEPFDHAEITDIGDMKRMLNGAVPGQVVDTRSWQHYIGDGSGYDYVHRSGRIPGTIWCHDKYFYHNIDGTMGNAGDMLANFKKNELNLDEKIAFFCGSASWRASLIVIFAKVFGLSNMSIYEGGWVQWQLDSANPTEKGVPQE